MVAVIRDLDAKEVIWTNRQNCVCCTCRKRRESIAEIGRIARKDMETGSDSGIWTVAGNETILFQLNGKNKDRRCDQNR